MSAQPRSLFQYAIVRVVPRLERGESLNVGVVLLFEPATGTSADRVVREVLRAYRATLPTAPFNLLADAPPLGLAHWRVPDAIDMRRHVLREKLPAPGTGAQLSRRLAELHRGMLDRRRPLFEIHLIDGLETGRVRSLKAPEVRGLGSGGSSSRARPKPPPP